MKTKQSAGPLFLAALFLLLLLSLPSEARAVEIEVFPEGSSYIPPVQQYIDQRYNPQIQPASGKLEIHLDDCPGVLAAGCYIDYTRKTPELWISSRYVDPAKADVFRKILFHELAHHLDFRTLRDDERVQFTNMLGFPAGSPWGKGVGEVAPREWFAEALSTCWYGPDRPYATYGWNFNYYETLPGCDAIALAVRHDNSWFGRRLAKATWQTIRVKARGTLRKPMRWGGRSIYVKYKSTTSWGHKCSKKFPFGTQGYVQLDICGTALVVKSTVPKPVDVSLYGLPVDPVVSPLSRSVQMIPLNPGSDRAGKTVVVD